jgi:hypothetical protein
MGGVEWSMRGIILVALLHLFFSSALRPYGSAFMSVTMRDI